jgi:hypothetical protein
MNLAEKFATLIDRKEFELAAEMVAEDCVYVGEASPHEGRRGVIAMYREYASEMSKAFDEVHYNSAVELIDGDTCRIEFTDSIRKGEKWHDLKTAQIIRFNSEGLVAQIEQREIPGELQAMRIFVMSVR